MPVDQYPVPVAGGGPARREPSAWTAGRTPARSVLSVVVLGLAALAAAAGGAWALASGEPGPGVLLLVGALYLGHLAGLGLATVWTPGRGGRLPRLATVDDDPGITFGYSWWPYYWLGAVGLLTTLGLLGVALLGALAGGGGLALAVVAGLFALAVGAFLVTVARLAPGRITLTPTGLHHRSLTFTHFVPWYAVFAVEAEWVGGPVVVVKTFPSEGTRIRRLLGRFGTQEAQLLPYLAVRGHWLAVDPVTVHRVLAFYHGHAEARPELATSAALSRIGADALPPAG